MAIEEEDILGFKALENFMQDLYQEALYISPGKTKKVATDSHYDQSPCQTSKSIEREKVYVNPGNFATSGISNPSTSMRWSSEAELIAPSDPFLNSKRVVKKMNSSSPVHEDIAGKENQLNTTKTRKTVPSKAKILQRLNMPVVTEKQSDAQLKGSQINKNINEDSMCSSSDDAASVCDPNELSENILKCLLSIFTQMRLPTNVVDPETSPSVSGSSESLRDWLPRPLQHLLHIWKKGYWAI